MTIGKANCDATIGDQAGRLVTGLKAIAAHSRETREALHAPLAVPS